MRKRRLRELRGLEGSEPGQAGRGGDEPAGEGQPPQVLAGSSCRGSFLRGEAVAAGPELREACQRAGPPRRCPPFCLHYTRGALSGWGEAVPILASQTWCRGTAGILWGGHGLNLSIGTRPGGCWLPGGGLSWKGERGPRSHWPPLFCPQGGGCSGEPAWGCHRPPFSGPWGCHRPPFSGPWGCHRPPFSGPWGCHRPPLLWALGVSPAPLLWALGVSPAPLLWALGGSGGPSCAVSSRGPLGGEQEISQMTPDCRLVPSCRAVGFLLRRAARAARPLGPSRADVAPGPGTELRRCGMARTCLQGVKYLMFAFNLLFWLGGCGILGVGIWLAVTQGNFATLSPSFPSLSAANLLIVMGTFVMAIGFVGCIGAIKEHKCLLLSFFVMLLTVFLLELVVAVLFFVYTDQIDTYAQRDLKKGLHLYGTEGNIGLTNAWSIIQTDFRCCGVSNYTDWFEVYNGTRVPDSCCLEFSDSCGLHSPGTWWKAPCYETVKIWLQENLLAVGIFGLCTALVQILGLTFAMTMYCQVAKADTYCA
uniref:Tetraspanin-4 n=2 Tax=Monodelphis domestica TaxID=13616 RepID=A0A5F8H2N9_MONDO